MITTHTKRRITRQAKIATGTLTNQQLAIMLLEPGFSDVAKQAAETELFLRAAVNQAAVAADVSAILDLSTVAA